MYYSAIVRVRAGFPRSIHNNLIDFFDRRTRFGMNFIVTHVARASNTNQITDSRRRRGFWHADNMSSAHEKRNAAEE